MANKVRLGIIGLASRRGPAKAIVAIERAMLVIIWQMSRTGAFYQDLG